MQELWERVCEKLGERRGKGLKLRKTFIICCALLEWSLHPLKCTSCAHIPRTTHPAHSPTAPQESPHDTQSAAPTKDAETELCAGPPVPVGRRGSPNSY